MKYNGSLTGIDNESSSAAETTYPVGFDERLIELIYEAPVEKEPWTSFLHYFRNRINANSVLMSFRLPWDHGEDIDIDVSPWHDRAFRELYYKKYCDQNPMDYESMVMGKIYTFDDFISREDFIKTAYYRDFCQPQQIDCALAVYLGKFNGLRAWISCSRDRGKGKFNAVEIEDVRHAIPHLQRAMNIYSLLEQYRSEKSIYSKTIDSMNIGSILLDRSGLITEKNESATTIMAESSCISEVGSRLEFCSPSDQQRYDHLIEKLLDECSSVD